MTKDKQKKMASISIGIAHGLHRSGLTHAQVIDVIATLLCNEARLAFQECGPRGTTEVFERFLKGCSAAIPGLGFQVIRR